MVLVLLSAHVESVRVSRISDFLAAFVEIGQEVQLKIIILARQNSFQAVPSLTRMVYKLESQAGLICSVHHWAALGSGSLYTYQIKIIHFC